MAKIPSYTKALVLNRAVADESDLGQISAAGMEARGVAKISDVGAQIATTIKNTQDTTAVNDGVITTKRELIEEREAFIKERADNPVGLAKDLEAFYKDKVKLKKEVMPSPNSQASFQREMDNYTLSLYQKDLTRETEQSVKMFVRKADKNIGDLDYRASQGESPEELRGDLTATIKQLQPVMGADEMEINFNQGWKQIVGTHINTLINTNPRQAKKVLKSGKYKDTIDVEQTTTLIDAANKGIRDEAYKTLDSDDPQQLIKDIDAGVYDGAMDDKEKSEFKDKAIKAFEAQDDKAAAQRSIDFAETNTEAYNQFVAGELTHADLTKMEQAGQDPEAIEAMRKSMLKRNPVSIEKQQAAIVELAQGYSDLKIEKKKGKIKYSGGLEDLVRFQRKVMNAEANGEINKSTASSFINKIVTPMLQKTQQEEGFDDQDWIGDADEPYDVAFQTIQDHLERTGQEQNTPLKAKMLTMAIEEADRLEYEKITDNDEKEKKLKELAKRVLVKYGEIENPVNRTLPDSPNGNIKPDGTVKRNGNFETKLPADAKADSTFKVLEDANGNKARVYYGKNGEVLKVEEM